MLEAKKYLEQIQRMDTQINNRWESLQKLYAMRTKMTTVFSMSAVSGSSAQNKLEDISIKIWDIEKEVNRKIDKFIELKLEATQLIDQLTDINHAMVLHKIYFEYKKIDEVAADIGVSTRSIRYWHNNALSALEEIRKRKVDNGKG